MFFPGKGGGGGKGGENEGRETEIEWDILITKTL